MVSGGNCRRPSPVRTSFSIAVVTEWQRSDRTKHSACHRQSSMARSTMRPNRTDSHHQLMHVQTSSVVTFHDGSPRYGRQASTLQEISGCKLFLQFQGLRLIMAALWNRAGHYIFVLWFLLSSSFFFPRLFSAVAYWMSTILPHMVWP